MLIPMTVRFELWENQDENEQSEGIRRELGEVSMLLDSDEIPDPERLLEGMQGSRKLRLLRKMLDRYIMDMEELEKEVMIQDDTEEMIQEINEDATEGSKNETLEHDNNGEIIQEMDDIMIQEMSSIMENMETSEDLIQEEMVETADEGVSVRDHIKETTEGKKKQIHKEKVSKGIKRPYVDEESKEDNRGSKKQRGEEESREDKKKKRREVEVRKFCEELMRDKREEESIALMMNSEVTDDSIDRLACWYEREEKNNTNGIWEWYSAGKELTEEIIHRIDQGVDEWVTKRKIYEEVREKLIEWGYRRSRDTISNKLMRTRKVYNLFEEIGVDRIHSCTSHSADWISRLSSGEIEEVKSYILKM
jgi:hypothetical protein